MLVSTICLEMNCEEQLKSLPSPKCQPIVGRQLADSQLTVAWVSTNCRTTAMPLLADYGPPFAWLSSSSRASSDFNTHNYDFILKPTVQFKQKHFFCSNNIYYKICSKNKQSSSKHFRTACILVMYTWNIPLVICVFLVYILAFNYFVSCQRKIRQCNQWGTNSLQDEVWWNTNETIQQLSFILIGCIL